MPRTADTEAQRCQPGCGHAKGLAQSAQRYGEWTRHATGFMMALPASTHGWHGHEPGLRNSRRGSPRPCADHLLALLNELVPAARTSVKPIGNEMADEVTLHWRDQAWASTPASERSTCLSISGWWRGDGCATMTSSLSLWQPCRAQR